MTDPKRGTDGPMEDQATQVRSAKDFYGNRPAPEAEPVSRADRLMGRGRGGRGATSGGAGAATGGAASSGTSPTTAGAMNGRSQQSAVGSGASGQAAERSAGPLNSRGAPTQRSGGQGGPSSPQRAQDAAFRPASGTSAPGSARPAASGASGPGAPARSSAPVAASPEAPADRPAGQRASTTTTSNSGASSADRGSGTPRGGLGRRDSAGSGRPSFSAPANGAPSRSQNESGATSRSLSERGESKSPQDARSQSERGATSRSVSERSESTGPQNPRTQGERSGPPRPQGERGESKGAQDAGHRPGTARVAAASGALGAAGGALASRLKGLRSAGAEQGPATRTRQATGAVPTPANAEHAAEPSAAAGAETTSSQAAVRRGGARRTRKARLRLAQVDPWSVMKTAFLFSVAAGIVLWVATGTVWAVIGSSGLFDSLNSMVGSIIQTPGDDTPFRIQDYVDTNRVMGTAALIAVIDVVIFTALATLAAFLYNLASAMIGGLEVTLAED